MLTCNLIGGLEHVWNMFFPVLEISIPTDFRIFQRGRYTTNQLNVNLELLTCSNLPCGKLTWLWKITISNRKTNYKWAMFNSFLLVYQRVHCDTSNFPKGHPFARIAVARPAASQGWTSARPRRAAAAGPLGKPWECTKKRDAEDVEIRGICGWCFSVFVQWLVLDRSLSFLMSLGDHKNKKGGNLQDDWNSRWILPAKQVGCPQKYGPWYV